MHAHLELCFAVILRKSFSMAPSPSTDSMNSRVQDTLAVERRTRRAIKCFTRLRWVIFLGAISLE